MNYAIYSVYGAEKRSACAAYFFVVHFVSRPLTFIGTYRKLEMSRQVSTLVIKWFGIEISAAGLPALLVVVFIVCAVLVGRCLGRL